MLYALQQTFNELAAIGDMQQLKDKSNVPLSSNIQELGDSRELDVLNIVDSRFSSNENVASITAVNNNNGDQGLQILAEETFFSKLHSKL